MGEFFGGIDSIQDPGGSGLIVKGKIENASSIAWLIVRNGRGALCLIDGKWYIVTDKGRYRVPTTGIWTFFPGIQNMFSRGKPTHANEFYFFDTDPDVYRDVQFRVDDLLCVDANSRQQVKCTPMVNVSLRIEEPEKFFNHLKPFDLKNDAVGTFMHNRVAPWVKNALYKASREKPIIDVNAEEIHLGQSVGDLLKNMMQGFGLTVRNAQITSMGISEESQKRMAEYYEAFSEAEREVGKVKIIADSLFNGDTEKAVKYVMMNRGISKDVGLNPIVWKVMEDLMKNGGIL